MCQAWARNEAGLHRSLASYVSMRRGRSDKARCNGLTMLYGSVPLTPLGRKGHERMENLKEIFRLKLEDRQLSMDVLPRKIQ